ncbi:MAG: hypothetical protein WC869_01340 [Phycisphaerae bacterium]|jgi:hypothetical protein
MGLFAWIKKLRRAVDQADATQSLAQAALHEAEAVSALVRERTTAHVDYYPVGDASHVVLIGHYCGRDFVQTYRIHPHNFGDLVHHLRELEKHAVVQTVDAPPVCRAVLERELRDL